MTIDVVHSQWTKKTKEISFPKNCLNIFFSEKYKNFFQ